MNVIVWCSEEVIEDMLEGKGYVLLLKYVGYECIVDKIDIWMNEWMNNEKEYRMINSSIGQLICEWGESLMSEYIKLMAWMMTKKLRDHIFVNWRNERKVELSIIIQSFFVDVKKVWREWINDIYVVVNLLI